MNVVWSKPVVVKGAPPVGESEVRCSGCTKRFVAGQMCVRGTWNIGPFPQVAYVHPECVAAFEARVA